jgi:hypothetical protein
LTEKESIGKKVSVLRTPLSLGFLVGAQRSWWIMIGAPLALFYTVLRLSMAAQQIPYAGFLVALGIVLVSFYVVSFCWNAFGRQELTFREGEMTIANRVLGMGRSRRVAIGNIGGIRLSNVGYRTPGCVVFEVRGRKIPLRFGKSLSKKDSLAILHGIGNEIPMLARKIRLQN